MSTPEARTHPGLAARPVAGARAVPWAAVIGVPCAAGLYVLASPPHAWAGLGWLAPGLLVWSLRGLRPRAAAGAGFVFGMLAAWGITGWVVGAAQRYFDAEPLRAGAVGLGLWLWCGGLGFAVFAGAWARVEARTPLAARGLVAAWLWVAIEWVRATALSGLPWALLAHTQFRHPEVLRIADLGGAYAVSFVMVAASVAVAEATAAPRRRALALLAPGVLLAATLAWGLRPPPAAAGRERTLVLVQGNVDNGLRWNPTYFARTLGAYVRLSGDATASARPDLVVWPENAVDFYLDAEPGLVPALRGVARRTQGGLLFGGPRLAGTAEARNAVHHMTPDGAVAAVHDKQHLVPLAEWMPWAAASGEEPAYAPGSDAVPVAAGDARLGVVVCIEAIFPPLVRRLAAQDVGMLVVVANDAWLDAGDGAALWQHFAATLLRAVETGRPLVRAAGTGITAAVEADGRIAALLPPHEAGTLLVRLRDRTGTTPYVRFGDAWIALAGAGLLALHLARRRRPT
ncbi:MAG: apolipoprotein N-acyltransferase [bacterium]|nr:apolipoprotein N-acyltransferase [bacterium]